MTKKPGTAAALAPALDLGALDLQADAERGATMQVLHPRTGQPTGATLLVYGADARAYRTALRRLRDGAAREFEREPTDEDDALMLGRARSAAAAIHGGSGLTLEGKALVYTPEEMVEPLFQRTWLADQVLAFIGTRGNFAPA